MLIEIRPNKDTQAYNEGAPNRGPPRILLRKSLEVLAARIEALGENQKLRFKPLRRTGNLCCAHWDF